MLVFIHIYNFSFLCWCIMISFQKGSKSWCPSHWFCSVIYAFSSLYFPFLVSVLLTIFRFLYQYYLLYLVSCICITYYFPCLYFPFLVSVLPTISRFLYQYYLLFFVSCISITYYFSCIVSVLLYFLIFMFAFILLFVFSADWCLFVSSGGFFFFFSFFLWGLFFRFAVCVSLSLACQTPSVRPALTPRTVWVLSLLNRHVRALSLSLRVCVSVCMCVCLCVCVCVRA